MQAVRLFYMNTSTSRHVCRRPGTSLLIKSRCCSGTGAGYRASVLARFGALEVLDAVRIGQAESPNAASAELLAQAVRPGSCSLHEHHPAVRMSSSSSPGPEPRCGA